jgi:hypothetical protein
MQPRLDHFIVRPDTEDGMPGPIVPLIAVDQLPDWMQVAGVPRGLDAEQTIGLTNLGIIEMGQDSTFEVRLHHDKIRAILDCADDATDSYSSGDGKARAKATKNKRTTSVCEIKSKTNEKAASDESLPPSPGGSIDAGPHVVGKPLPRGHSTGRMASTFRHNIDNSAVDVQARGGSNSAVKNPRPHMVEATRNEPRHTGPQRTTAKQDKQPATAFCRHWCYHGTCKWGLQCRYVHRMPTTVEGLREVGLKDFPTWYLLMMGNASSELPWLSSMDALLSGLEGLQLSAQQYTPAQQPQPLLEHHVPDPPPPDLGLGQGRISALLAPDSPVSNEQRLKQIREMRHLVLRGSHATQGQQRPRPHKNSNYANLYTNASVAANAASIRRQADHQRRTRDNMPVVTRSRARASSSVEDGRDGGGDGGVDLLPARKGGRASNDCAGAMNAGSLGLVASRASFSEEKLVDLD